MNDQQNIPNQLNIEISEEVAEGSYANLAIITHTKKQSKIEDYPDSSTCQTLYESPDREY